MIVIANGMLRSGSTLQYNIAASVLETTRLVKRSGFMGGFAERDVRETLDSLKAAHFWAIVKTHEPPLERAFYDSNVRVLFSYRDVRDIAASIRKKWGYPFERILSDIDAMIEIERQFDEIPNVLTQPYELLYENLPEATMQLSAFFGVELPPNALETIVNQNSIAPDGRVTAARPGLIKSLSRLFGREVHDRRTLLHGDHISESRGRAGDWQSQFSPDEVDTLSDRYANWLLSHAYLET